MSDPPRSRLISVQDAARELGVGRATLFAYMKKGALTGYRVAMDRKTYLDRNELRRLMRPRSQRNESS